MRKHPLLKKEIEMIQDILRGVVYPTGRCRLELREHLGELKLLWYPKSASKSKGTKK